MRGILLFTALMLSAGVDQVGAQLNYVECSTGFQDNPEMEGGRTELEFADINNDGNVDILCIGDHGNPYINTQEHGVMVWFGDGQGNWSVYQYGDFGYGGIAIGDVNRDGRWDIGYGMHHNYSGTDLGDQILEVALGDGTGRMWTAWDDSLGEQGQNWGMFATDFADIDNDGDLDVGSISFGADDGLHVYLNLGNGAWHRSFGFDGGNSTMHFYFRDVNRDGNADIIAGHGTGTVWLGDGQGGFTPASSGLPSSSFGLGGLGVGDVDNDGGCDLAYTTSSGGVEVRVWSEQLLTWQNFSGTLPVADSFYATQLCDMNADGFVDVLAFRRGRVQVWLGDGLGNWTEAAQVALPRPNTFSAFRAGADFDHNGYPDFALVSREGNWPNDYNTAHAFREGSPADTLRVFPVFPRGGEKFADGAVQFIDWWSEAPAADSTRVRLELSIAGPGGPWEVIADTLRNGGRFQWFIPSGIASADCYVRHTVTGPGGAVEAMTPRAFSIGDTLTGVAERLTPDAGRRTRRLRGVWDVSGRRVRGAWEPGVYFPGGKNKVVVLD